MNRLAERLEEMGRGLSASRAERGPSRGRPTVGRAGVSDRLAASSRSREAPSTAEATAPELRAGTLTTAGPRTRPRTILTRSDGSAGGGGAAEGHGAGERQRKDGDQDLPFRATTAPSPGAVLCHAPIKPSESQRELCGG